MAPKIFTSFIDFLKKNKAEKALATRPEPIPQLARVSIGSGAIIGGHYRLDHEIGKGGMGVVYGAKDISTGRNVAIKIINFTTANVLTREQFEMEIQITRRLKHPHIVEILETGAIDIGGIEPLAFIVMELVNGMGLDEIHGFTFNSIVDIGQQICEALDAAHGLGFVHRDLKPGNVLVERRGFRYFAKLADFGLARPRGMQNRSNENGLAGSLFYLSPEVIAGEAADISSDLYALGAMFYEMVTGRVPFSNIDEQTILTQHMEEPPAPPSHSRADVPLALEEIILRLLAKNPKARYTSALQVRDALENVPIPSRLRGARGNLPDILTKSSFYSGDVEQVIQLLESSRMVTILDESDTLALAIGSQLESVFPNGVWLIDLKSVNKPELVLQVIIEKLGIAPDIQRSMAVTLMDYLHENKQLFLFTHCDDLLYACALFVETTINTCPDVCILVTSKNSMNIAGEKKYFPQTKL